MRNFTRTLVDPFDLILYGLLVATGLAYYLV